MSQEVEAHILKRYNLIKKVGSGAYGHVWKVTDKRTGCTLALKKIFDAFQHSTDAQRTYRQIVFLHQLDHPNIIKLHQVYRAENDKDLYLVFEYMEADLHNAIGQKILKDIHNRFILYQLAKGIKFLHSSQLLHRDLKPSNILLNSDCVLKICDFGLARSLVADEEGADIVLTQEVATRWYRAPQVLLGSQNYDKSADIWSIGCILAQIILGKPLFPGNSTLNQLERILSFTGKPKKQDILSLNSQIAGTMIDSIPQIKQKNPSQWFKPQVPAQAVNLIYRLLQLNPQKRLTINQILSHPYLIKFHNPKQQYQNNKVIQPPISDNKKLNLKQYRNLIYQRIKKIYKDKEKDQIQFIKNKDSLHIVTQQDNKQSSKKKQSSSKYITNNRQLTTAPPETRSRPTSALKQSNNQSNYLHRHSSKQLKNYQLDEQKKKNSLKDILTRTKKNTPSFKQQSSLYNNPNQKSISTTYNNVGKYYKNTTSQIGKQNKMITNKY